MFNTACGIEPCHYYDPRDKCLKVVASADAPAGEQLFISYGNLASSRECNSGFLHSVLVGGGGWWWQ